MSFLPAERNAVEGSGSERGEDAAVRIKRKAQAAKDFKDIVHCSLTSTIFSSPAPLVFRVAAAAAAGGGDDGTRAESPLQLDVKIVGENSSRMQLHRGPRRCPT